MIIQKTASAVVRSLVVIGIAAGSFTVAVPDASAKNCYRVVNASSLNVRAKPRKTSAILTTVKGDTIVEKSGLPACGLWWCKVDTGRHVGYAGSKYLKKAACP